MSSVAGAERLLLATEGERMDLAVAMDRAVRTGEHEAVVRPPVLVVVGRIGGQLRAGAADPDAVFGGLRRQERGRRAALGLAEVGHVDGEAGRERLGAQHEPRPGARRGGDHRREVLEVGLAVVPLDVVLQRGDDHLLDVTAR